MCGRVLYLMLQKCAQNSFLLFHVNSKNLFHGCEINSKLEFVALISMNINWTLSAYMLQDVNIAELVIFLPLKVDSIVSVLASDAFCHLFFKSQAFVFPIVSSVCAKLRTMGGWCECDGALGHEMRSYYPVVFLTIYFLYLRLKIPHKQHTVQRRELSSFSACKPLYSPFLTVKTFPSWGTPGLF